MPSHPSVFRKAPPPRPVCTYEGVRRRCLPTIQRSPGVRFGCLAGSCPLTPKEWQNIISAPRDSRLSQESRILGGRRSLHRSNSSPTIARLHVSGRSSCIKTLDNYARASRTTTISPFESITQLFQSFGGTTSSHSLLRPQTSRGLRKRGPYLAISLHSGAPLFLGHVLLSSQYGLFRRFTPPLLTGSPPLHH